MVWKNDQVSFRETEEILRYASEVLELGISGDFVEMGCYKGDTALMLAEALKRYERIYGRDGKNGAVVEKDVENCVENDVENGGFLVEKDVDKPVEKGWKKLWIYDSFEGLPEKGEFDNSVLGEGFKKGELLVTKREVKERFLRAGLKVPVIKKGWFSELRPEDLPEKIAFSFLDGDFYESIRDSLRLVEKRMSSGGKLLIHDYNNPALPGVRRAVDEWMAGKRALDFRVFESMAVVGVLVD